MKKEELRIGNWVLHKPYGNRDGEPVQIAGILGMKAYYSKYNNEGGMFHYLFGIPLTPAILEKAGFEMMSNGFMSTPILRASIRIAYHHGDATECSLFQHGIEFPLAAGQIKYLHSLQNIFAALTGEELKINL